MKTDTLTLPEQDLLSRPQLEILEWTSMPAALAPQAAGDPKLQEVE